MGCITYWEWDLIRRPLAGISHGMPSRLLVELMRRPRCLPAPANRYPKSGARPAARLTFLLYAVSCHSYFEKANTKISWTYAIC